MRAPQSMTYTAQITDHHVLGLHVAVDDAALMRKGQGIADLVEDLDGVGGRSGGHRRRRPAGSVCPRTVFMVK